MKKLLGALFFFFVIHLTYGNTNVCLSDTTLDVELYTNGTVEFSPPSLLNTIKGVLGSIIKKREQSNQNETKIFSKKSDKGKSHGKVLIAVPKNTNLKFQTAIGDVSLTDLEGNVKGHADGGGITLTRGKGKVELTTDRGDILVTDTEASGFVLTRSGNIVLQDVNGDLKGLAPSGKVVVKTTSGFFTKRNSKAFALEYDNVDLDIASAPEGGEFKLNKGNIVIGEAKKNSVVRTNDGNINVNSVGAGIRASTRKGKISIQIPANNNASEPIIIENQDGDVELLVSNNFSANFNISLIQTKNLTSANQVTSFIDLGTTAAQESKDAKTNVVYGRETQITKIIRSGRRPVNIRVVNGNVYIRKI
ncbi:MAG TPA: hypothetical protein DCM71_28305 [Runella sp.]|nr:hypothetical protein [Runella sp.]